jgi:hypothetical protein
MSVLRSFATASLLARLRKFGENIEMTNELTVYDAVGSSSAQTVTGTLFGVVYPSAIAHTTDQGMYVIPGTAVPYQPQVSIVGIDTGLQQTTFAYHDIYTRLIPEGSFEVMTQFTESGALTCCPCIIAV